MGMGGDGDRVGSLLGLGEAVDLGDSVALGLVDGLVVGDSVGVAVVVGFTVGVGVEV
jgi:hypothetical protein